MDRSSVYWETSGGLFEASLKHLSALFRSVWAPLGASVRAVRGPLGASCGSLGASGGPLGAEGFDFRLASPLLGLLGAVFGRS